MSSGTALSVVIVTYNSRRFVDECLEAVLRTTKRHRLEIIVADNASPDGTADHLKEYWPNITLLEMGRNAGFATANNAAWSRSNGRHIVLLNDDVIVKEGALEAMVDFLDDTPTAGVVAPRLVSPDGSDQQTAGAFPAGIWGRRSPLKRTFPNNRWSSRYPTGRDHLGDEPFEVDSVSGACLMVPRTVIDQVGLSDDVFFMHWQAADWCRLIKGAGHQVWVEPAAEVVQAEGGSRSGWASAQIRHFHHGAYGYYRKHHRLRGPLLLARPSVAGTLALRAGALLVRNAAKPPSARLPSSRLLQGSGRPHQSRRQRAGRFRR